MVTPPDERAQINEKELSVAVTEYPRGIMVISGCFWAINGIRRRIRGQSEPSKCGPSHLPYEKGATGRLPSFMERSPPNKCIIISNYFLCALLYRPRTKILPCTRIRGLIIHSLQSNVTISTCCLLFFNFSFILLFTL